MSCVCSWMEEVVSFEGAFHKLDNVNINPLPAQKPIPIWIGAGRTENPVPPDAVLARIGRKADGWCPLFRIADGAETLDLAAQQAISKVNSAAIVAGRNSKSVELELGLYPDGKDRNNVLDEIAALHGLGANHIHVRFAGKTGAEQTDSLKRFMDLIS